MGIDRADTRWTRSENARRWANLSVRTYVVCLLLCRFLCHLFFTSDHSLFSLLILQLRQIPTKGNEKRSLCGLFLGKFYSLLFVLVCCFGVYLCSFSQHARFGLICFDRCHCYYRIHHQKSRYVYDLFYRRKAISRGTIFFLLCKYTEQIKIMMSIL